MVKVKVKFNPDEAPRAGGGIEVWRYSSFNLGAIWEWVVNVMPRPLYPRERDPLPTV